MVPGTGSLISGVIAIGAVIVAFLWFIFTLAEGDNPLAIIRDFFDPPGHADPVMRYGQNETESSDPVGQAKYEVMLSEEDPYSEEALEEAKCKKQLAINYFYYFAGKEKLIERAMEAKSENRGRRR